MFMDRYPDIEADGEMHADAALEEKFVWIYSQIAN